MKKRMISILLTVCSVVALFSCLSASAYADVDTTADTTSGYLVAYTMAQGDTVLAVCNKLKINYYDVSNLITKVNNIKNYSALSVGTLLYLPMDSAGTSDDFYTLHTHKLAEGDTISDLCKKYGIDYSKNSGLISALNSNASNLVAGQNLVIPVYDGKKTPAAAASGTIASSGASTSTSAAPVGSDKVGKDDTVLCYLDLYTIQLGDTMESICSDKGIDLKANSTIILRSNGITSYESLITGKSLYIPLAECPKNGAGYQVISHKVVSGDSAYALCLSYDTDYNKNLGMMQKINNKSNMAMLSVGQTLLIPVPYAVGTGAPAASSGAAGTGGAAAAPSTGAAASGSTGSSTGSSVPAAVSGDYAASFVLAYKMQSGDTVGALCNNYGIDFAANSAMIMKLSNIKSYNYIKAGTTVFLPMATKPSSGSGFTLMAHKMVSGDTVYNICLNYGISYYNNLKLLQAVNKRDNLANVYAGQTIYIPVATAFTGGTASGGTASGGTASGSTSSTGSTTTGSTTTPYAIYRSCGANGSVTVTVDDATVTASLAGKTVKINPSPSNGYEVDAISVNQKNSEKTAVSVKDNQFVMPANAVTVYITFKAGGHELTKTATTNGSFKIMCDGDEADKLAAGQTVSVVCQPDDGFLVDSITAVNSDTSEAITVTNGKFTMPAAKVTVAVTFRAVEHKTVATSDESTGKFAIYTGGSDIYGASTTVVEGAKVTLAAPAGKTIDTITVWKTGDDATKLTITDNSFIMPGYDVTIKLTYK